MDPMAIMASMERPMQLIGRLKAAIPHDLSISVEQAGPAGTGSAEETFRIHFRPFPEFQVRGGNILELFQEWMNLGSLGVMAFTRDLPDLESLDPGLIYLGWDLILTTCRGELAIRDPLLLYEDECEVRIERVETGSTFDPAPLEKRLGEILVERGVVKPADVRTILQKRVPLGEKLVADGVVEAGKVQGALFEQEQLRQIRRDGRVIEMASHLRISMDKLDRLVSQIGELVTVQARLGQVSQGRKDGDLVFVAEELGRLTERLRESYMQIRMQPIGLTFFKFEKMVRDLGIQLGKKIDMKTQGGETELDKATIEKLNDPLVHLIRNSCDHGLETPEVRMAAGKPPTGTVLLAAEHSGGHVLLRISDDGAGLDGPKIREKAIQKGLIAPDAELSLDQMNELIFLPGFSTAAKVSDLSGRGSGLDVVKTAIEELRGSISIKTRPGQGATFIFKVPLTLASMACWSEWVTGCSSSLSRLSGNAWTFPGRGKRSWRKATSLSVGGWFPT